MGTPEGDDTALEERYRCPRGISVDGDHCNCWYVGFECCYCGAPPDDEVVEANRPH